MKRAGERVILAPDDVNGTVIQIAAQRINNGWLLSVRDGKGNWHGQLDLSDAEARHLLKLMRIEYED